MVQYYILYKTTNLISGKYYIGCHQTNNLNDGYIGSGKLLKSAIKKYGRENFKCEILSFYDNKDDMFAAEQKIVNESLVKDDLSYNLKIGGSGGNPGIVGAFSGRKHTDESKEKIRQKALQQVTPASKHEKLVKNNWAKRNPEQHHKHVSKISKYPKSEEHKEKLRQNALGKKHTEETKQKMRKKHSERPPMSDEQKQKIREAMLKYYRSKAFSGDVQVSKT